MASNIASFSSAASSLWSATVGSSSSPFSPGSRGPGGRRMGPGIPPPGANQARRSTEAGSRNRGARRGRGPPPGPSRRTAFTSSAVKWRSMSSQLPGTKQVPLAVRVRNFPVFIFYKYLWKTNRRVLLTSLFLSYVLPLAQERVLPWWASRRKVGNALRGTRIALQTGLSSNRPLSHSMLFSYALGSVYLMVLEAVERQARARLALRNKFLVRRMVIERLLFSDIGAFDGVRPLELEARIQSDVTQTLNLVNFTIPSLLGGIYAFWVEGKALWQSRSQLDPLMILQPALTAGISKAADWFRRRVMDDGRLAQRQANLSAMGDIITSALDGLPDIQVNNLQPLQLELLDMLMDTELKQATGVKSAGAKVWAAATNRSLLSFIMEMTMVSAVMRRRGLSHEEFRTLQSDVERLSQVARRTWAMGRMAKATLDLQGRISELLDIPNFAGELDAADPKAIATLLPFKELLIKDIVFRYSADPSKARAAAQAAAVAAAAAAAASGASSKDAAAAAAAAAQAAAGDAPDADNPALGFSGEIRIVPGRSYAIIGQNRSGKSTLTHLICKLYAYQGGSMAVNGTPYEIIPRVALRRLVAYVAQRPFIFPGTIRDNIMVGNPAATEAEVIAAAEAAGVFAFALGDESVVSNSSPSSPPSCSCLEDELLNSGKYDSLLFPKQESLTLDELLPPGWKPPCPVHSTRPLGPDASAPSSSTSRLDRLRSVLDYETRTRGSNLSGGFGQSVALARAFLRTDARIVILDEAMGQMDAFKKREIILPRLFSHVRKHNQALIVVTHDLSLCPKLEHVVLLDKGELVAQGAHDQLMANKEPLYLKLMGGELETQ